MSKLSFAPIILLVLTFLYGCAPGEKYLMYEGSVWATTFHITYRSDRQLDDSIQAVMAEVERSLSPFSDSSLVSAINRGDTDVVDSLFVRVFEAAQRVNAASGGMFDPTVGPLVELWGFGRNREVDEPTTSQIDSCLQTVGIGRCILVGNRIIKASPATRFDFSAITKGYGCDLVGEMLRRNGCNDYMIEIGGEIALSGRSSRGSKWRIMVEAPIDNDTTIEHNRLAVVELTDCGVATSGNYRNFHDFASGRKGHTISPVTGQPVQSTILSATVIAPNAMMADALATACMAMSSNQALAMIEGMPQTEALLVESDGAGGWKTQTTKGFPELK